MARTRRTIPLDEKIEKAQAAVFQAKDKYDAAVEELNKLQRYGDGPFVSVPLFHE